MKYLIGALFFIFIGCVTMVTHNNKATQLGDGASADNKKFMAEEPPWASLLHVKLSQISESLKKPGDGALGVVVTDPDTKPGDGALGVVVTDPDTGFEVGINHDRYWYLASTVKVPIAIEVLHQIELGKFTFDTKLKFKTTYRRDGAGSTSFLAPGASVTVRTLLEEMLQESDNAATDILVELVGIDSINNTLRALEPEGFRPITSLLEVRRSAYKELHPLGAKLDQEDFIKLKKSGGYTARYKAFSKLVGIPTKYLRYATLQEAFEQYYSKGLNSGLLQAYNQLLLKIHERKAISPFVSESLYQFMTKCRTGKKRIIAGLPKGSIFAHKTGTQVARLCDMGILTLPTGKVLMVSACMEKWKTMKYAEATLAKVGRAIAESLNVSKSK